MKFDTHNKKSINLILTFIILMAGILRLWHVSSNPPSLYWEEAALGYDAYSILKTGSDFHGHHLPVVAFESFGDYKPSGYFYALVPSLAIFGLSAFAVRLPSVLAGCLAVYLVYALARQLHWSQKASMLSALCLAIMPWHIQFSRAAFEVNVATTLFLAALVLLLASKKNQILIVPSALFSLASLYTYHGLRVVTPLLIVASSLPLLKFFRASKWFYLSLLIAFLGLLPLLRLLHSPVVSQRFNETSLFSVSNAVVRSNHQREMCGNTLVCRLVYHRYWYWGGEVIGGMVSHFNPKFLFLKGDANPRHQPLSMGLLYFWQLPCLVFGLFTLFKRRLYLSGYVLVIWLSIASLAPALTKTTPHSLRFLPAAPAFALLTGMGFSTLLSKRGLDKHQSKLRLVISFLPLIILTTISVVEFTRYLEVYFTTYPVQSSQAWQYGYKEVVTYLNSHYPTKTIWFSRDHGRPSIYVWFFSQTDPKKVQALNSIVAKDQGEFLSYGMYQFGGKPNDATDVFVTTKPESSKTLKEQINFLDGSPAFYIYEP